jgi:cysteine desulfurase
MSKSIYLDYAAASPLDADVLKAMQPYFSDKFFNPSANYMSSRSVKKDIESARQNVAKVLGAKSNEIVFTSGGTEANNLAINGVMEAYPSGKLIISAIEHPSLYAPAARYSPKICPVDNHGIVDIKALEGLIDESTVLISIMYVNNEIGSIQHLTKIAELVKQIRLKRREKGNSLPLLIHTDACQAANYLDLHASRLGIDLMSLNGGKIYGPKQSGALFVKSGIKIVAQITGGGQERNLRSGTENVAGIIGFSKALEAASTAHKQESARLSELQRYFIQGLSEIKSATINGSESRRIANNVHVTFSGIDNEWLLIKLDDSSIMAAAGSACSASSLEASKTLKAIGLTDEQARSSIRFSMGSSTTKKDLRICLDVLSKLIAQNSLANALI